MEVARGRGVEMRSLSETTMGYAELAQGKWTSWLKKQGIAARVPEKFADLLAAVRKFADAPLTARAASLHWQPASQHWLREES